MVIVDGYESLVRQWTQYNSFYDQDGGLYGVVTGLDLAWCNLVWLIEMIVFCFVHPTFFCCFSPLGLNEENYLYMYLKITTTKKVCVLQITKIFREVISETILAFK